MATPGNNEYEPHPEDPGRRDLEDKLKELGLDAQCWMPKLQAHLGVTSAQALQHVQHKEILALKSQAKHPWEQRALEKLFSLSNSQGSEKMQEKHWVLVKKRQEWAQSALNELREMQAAGKSREEAIVREKEEELRQAMDIPPKYWPLSEKPLGEVIETMKRNLRLVECTLSHRENLPERELLKRVSGGLALQGIYQTNHPEDLLERREELISFPENFFLLNPEQRTRMETKEFLSSSEESKFTQSMEKLGFSVSFLTKGGGWGLNLETSTKDNRSSDSRVVQKSHSEETYSCTTKFSYIPLASCHFARDQLHLSKSALQELKQLEELLSHSNGEETHHLLGQKCEAFFKRFGSHVNQGPLHLGGIFWWKAVAEGFKSEALHDVKRQASEALDRYIGGSYSGFGVTAAGMVNVSKFHSQMTSQITSSTNLQAKFEMSIYQTGGPPEIDSLPQWKAGLLASNHSWCIIDRGYQLVPVWDIILSSHRQDFQDPLQVTRCLTSIYTKLTGRHVSIQDGEELLRAVGDARSLIEEVKSWEITEPQEKLMKLINFLQKLSEKTRNYNIWINICLRDPTLQQFLVDIVNFCKDFPIQEIKYIKFQLRNLLYPHVYEVKDFPQRHSIMKWVFHSAKKQDIRVTEFADFIQFLEKAKNDLFEFNHSDYLEKIEDAQRKATYEISLSLSSFLKTLKEAEEPGIYLLLLCIAAGAGYKEENQTFHCLLGHQELNFLLCEMKEAHEKYQCLHQKSEYRAQAFLLFTGLTVTPGPIAVSAEAKKQRLELMQSHMGQSWSKEVLHVLLKPRVSHDWETLEKDLNLLINGEHEATVNCLQMEQVKKELESVFQGKKKIQEPEPCTMKQHEVIKNSDFLDLAKRLGLEDFYPRKMGRADFHLIYKSSVHDSQPDTERQLPFYFLQKLLMLDYRLRYLVCKDDGDTMASGTLTLTNLQNDTSDPYDDLFDDSDTSFVFLSTDQPHIHPMDTQMMIFHCADDFMRQYVSNKLAICQFALPLVVLNPCTSVIEFPLWSLSQIKRSWREVKKSWGEDTIINFNNQFISQAPIPIVSFIRVVNSASSSKSQILNSLLSKHKHDVFFHRDCRGNSKSCLLMGGLVEISWFCPGGRDEDRLESCVAFTNLRGDAKDHEAQLRFLQDIASVTVVLVSASDKTESTRNMVRNLWKSPKPLVCLFDDKDKTVSSDAGEKVRIGIRNRNEAEIMDELSGVINRLLKSSGPFLTLEDCAEIARRHGFLVDVDRKECQEAKEKAEVVMALMKEIKLSEMKEKLLPLQGELWHQWCKKDKELCHLREKGNRSLEQHKCEIEEEKQGIRQAQLQKICPLNELMKSVLETLHSHSGEDNSTKLYFLQWLSMFMDNLTRDELEKLQKSHNHLWSLVLAENQKESVNIYVKNHQVELESVSNDIRNSSLGIEHLLREVGQIYEALEETSSKRYPLSFSLPEIAADLMISGYPLELMDGDASYVPLTWVAAVFDTLIEKIGDEKIFVLSVLGLQSTGKSTLLNAMFGLQFNVSAGRCTRGAYMQLLKVEKTLWEELGFGFVLVVDTEGLRAPELASKSQNWDNELATFVIGLGNLTLINIFGENPSEMQDILQIALQAFLRMKQVNISPSCLFVHQNVGEITAKDQNMEGRRRLQQRLDEMAATAAEQEQLSDISHFSDVIRFDVNMHVHYFAHLWEGDPPMAPPNPSYSHNIQELKKGILLAAKKESQGSILKMSEVKVRIQDLWKALLNENFIFSFRNTREVMVMIKLETMYNQWTWNLRSHVLDLQNQLTNQIQNGEIQDLPRSLVEMNIAEKYEVIRQELQRYFDEDPENEILIQWKGNFENKLRNLKEALISESIRKSNDLLSAKKGQDKLNKNKSEYEKELLLRSREVALSYIGKELSEKELREIFIPLWTKWVHEVSSNSPLVEDPNIYVDLENVFLDHFKQECTLLSKLKDHCKKFSIDHEKHVKMKKKLTGFWKTSISESDKETIDETTKNITKQVLLTVDSKLRMGMDYNKSYFHELLQLIDKLTDSASDEARYTFTNEYKIDLSLCICYEAATSFRDMHIAFKRVHDPVIYLENKREYFFMCFKISCQGATSITAFVDFLWNKLIDSLHIAIWKKIALDLAGDIRTNCPAFNGNRSNLEKHILISLAKEENFENYWQYINKPKQFFERYIEKEIRAYCMSKGNATLNNFLNNSLEHFKEIIFSAICESTLVAKDQNNSASVWLDTLCKNLGRHLTLPREELRNIEHQEITDIEFLKEAMNEYLDTRIQNFGENCEMIFLTKVEFDIQAMLSDQLSGCWKQCPFCKAICTNTVINHCEDHSVPFHRSKAVTGTRWHKTDEFAIDFCTSSVASDTLFILPDDRRIPYKTYRQAGGEYATWSITPDTSAQPYWKWFVCRFRSELEEKYKITFTNRGEIPENWFRITREDVLSDMNK